MKAEHTEKLSEPRNLAVAREAAQDFLKVYHSHLGKLRKALQL